jgi:hypothetical protein
MSNTEQMAARLAELRQIEQKAGGVLQPESVVDFARNPKTALHGAFTWDDTEAARKYRTRHPGWAFKMARADGGWRIWRIS